MMSLEISKQSIKAVKPKVSVIVPVYNVELWIRKSLDSLVNQTLKEIEIVIIDDGSPDKCPEIIDEYAKRDSRIVVIHQENQGYGSAVYNGMLKATGEYIGFADPDDYVDLDFYEKLYLDAINNKADIVKGNVKIIHTNGYEEKIDITLSNDEDKFKFNSLYVLAIYNHEMLKKHKLYFENRKDMVIAQDLVFLLKALYFATKVSCISGTYYHYYLRQSSLTFQAYDIKKIRSLIIALNLRANFFNEYIDGLDKKSYIYIYNNDIQYILNDVIHNKNNTIEGSIALIKAAIELYGKCLYKEDLKKHINQNIIVMLENKDELAMFHDYVVNYRPKFLITKWTIFNLIPFITIKTKENYTRYDLFGFLPLLKVKTRKNRVYYKLFNVLPLIRKEIQRN